MTTFRRLFLKKILENKKRLFLITINFSLVLFLVMFLFTVGINVKKYNERIFSKNPLYKQILVTLETSDVDAIEEMSHLEGVNKIFVETESESIVLDIDGSPLSNIAVAHQFMTSSNLFSDLDIFIIGRSLRSPSEIIVSKQYIDQLGISIEASIGKSVTLSNGEDQYQKTIVGVYDAKRLITSDYNFIILDPEENEAFSSLIVLTHSGKDVPKIIDYLKENDYNYQDFASEYKVIHNISSIINISLLFMGTFLLFIASTLLANSTKVSIMSKYQFISLLKAVGYPRKVLNKFVYVELVIITGISCLLSFFIYSISLRVFLKNISVDKLFPMEEINFMDINILAVLLTVILSVVMILYSSMKSIRTIKKLDVISLFKEGVL